MGSDIELILILIVLGNMICASFFSFFSLAPIRDRTRLCAKKGGHSRFPDFQRTSRKRSDPQSNLVAEQTDTANFHQQEGPLG
jgi:hypothetical protein